MIIIEKREQTIFSIINKYEFELTKMLLDQFEVDFDTNGEIIYNYSYIDINNKTLAFPSDYIGLDDMYKNQSLVIFRPFKNERHTNILIKMFEDLPFIDYDTIQIKEIKNPETNRVKYRGWLEKNNKIVEGSFISKSPSEQLLKISIIANMLMDDKTHEKYYNTFIDYLKNKKR